MADDPVGDSAAKFYTHKQNSATMANIKQITEQLRLIDEEIDRLTRSQKYFTNNGNYELALLEPKQDYDVGESRYNQYPLEDLPTGYKVPKALIDEFYTSIRDSMNNRLKKLRILKAKFEETSVDVLHIESEFQTEVFEWYL